MPIVRKEQKVDDWSVLIRGAQGKAGNIFGNTGNLIDQTNVPDVRIEKKRVAPGFIRGIFGAKRDFLIVTQTTNPKLRPYQMFIGARDYGNNLDVSWYLTYRLSFMQRLIAFFCALPLISLLFLSGELQKKEKENKGDPNLDFFDEQDLRAYVTNAHKCLQDAVDKLMLELNQDPSKIDRKSRGFLGIS
ncbi:MAG: hypothetical protein ABII89_02330 [Candidatus Omnitrophota bacterium]